MRIIRIDGTFVRMDSDCSAISKGKGYLCSNKTITKYNTNSFQNRDAVKPPFFYCASGPFSLACLRYSLGVIPNCSLKSLVK